MYIYLIENKINSKVYIGKTQYKNPLQRWSSHKSSAMKNPKHPISYAISKYGFDNFSFIPFQFCNNKEELIQEEIYWISQIRDYLGVKMVYNVSDGGSGGHIKGRPLSEEHKRKLSESAKISINSGRFSKNHMVTVSMRKSVSDSNRKRLVDLIAKEKFKNVKPTKTSFKKGNIPWNKSKVNK